MNAPPNSFCARHSAVSAVSICDRCGSFSCAECTQWGANGATTCPNCTTEQKPLAERGTRFVANLIDNFFILLLPAIVAGFGIVLTGVAAGAAGAGDDDGPSGVLALVMFGLAGLAFMAGCGVQLYFQIQHGRSVGKYLMGIRVVRLDGSPVEVWRIIVLRNLVVQLLAQMCGLVGLVDALMIYGEPRRCLHDLLADTIVVSDPRKER